MNRRAPADGPGALSVYTLPAREALVSPPRVQSGRLHVWIIGGLSLFVWGLYTSLAAGVNPVDEAWFLQVANRIMHGDVLYRDVFFGATPLSVYLTLPFVAFFGVEILAVKLLAVTGFVLTLLVCCRIAGQLGLPRQSLLLLVPALLVFAPPPATALYQPLANLFLIGCFSVALDLGAVKAGPAKPVSKLGLVSAGASAGLACACKQDIGLYVLAALLLAVGIAYYRRQFDRPALWASIAAIFAAFVCAALLAVLPVWLSGGAEKFLEYGFTNKATYLRLAGVSYWDGLSQLASALAGPFSLDAVRELIPQLAYLLPPITLGALAAAWLAFRRERDRVATICCFVGAAVLGMFPRADPIHVAFGIPAVLVGLVYAWQQFRAVLSNAFGRIIQSGIVLVLGLWLLSSGVDPLARAARGELVVSTLPHFGGILLPADELVELRSSAAQLAKESAGKPLFVLSASAGFDYLLANLSNPTPFDFPLATAFGLDGEQQVIDELARGQISQVCWQHWAGPLSPAVLEDYVNDHMKVRSDLSGFCTLYESAR